MCRELILRLCGYACCTVCVLCVCVCVFFFCVCVCVFLHLAHIVLIDLRADVPGSCPSSSTLLLLFNLHPSLCYFLFCLGHIVSVRRGCWSFLTWFNTQRETAVIQCECYSVCEKFLLQCKMGCFSVSKLCRWFCFMVMVVQWDNSKLDALAVFVTIITSSVWHRESKSSVFLFMLKLLSHEFHWMLLYYTRLSLRFLSRSWPWTSRKD